MPDTLLVLDLDGTILDASPGLEPALVTAVRDAAARIAPPRQTGGRLALLGELLPEYFTSLHYS